jgi:hypothetical protein
MQPPTRTQQRLFTAVVHAADGIRFVGSARCPEHLTAQICEYIGSRCDEVLWPTVGRQVRDLIRDRQPYAAIALYFAAVGDRWDDERLELDGLSFADATPSARLAEVG